VLNEGLQSPKQFADLWIILFFLQVGTYVGYGECAMPPKKPGIYLANYDDCMTFFLQFRDALSGFENHLAYNPFSNVDSSFFECTSKVDSESKEITVVRALFGVMDSLKHEKEFRVCRNALEMALLDLWGQMLQISTAKLIQGSREWNISKPTYYTIAMNSDLEEMKSSVKFGLQHTPYLKLKMDKNVSFWTIWLPQLHQICSELTQGKSGLAKLNGIERPFVWSIDANADWNPEVATQMLGIIAPYKDIISMVEQPFGAHLEETEIVAWKVVKSDYAKAGFVIYADESVSTSEDLKTLYEICHGVNIKLDKAGGVREALRIWKEATDVFGLGVWIGIMVSSRLSTTMASCILPLSTLGGDLDGQLLVDVQSDKFTGGLNWDVETGLCSPPTVPGLGLKLKQ
jgi:L-alanine-DL-glutamate epimerase-like enolase superfamily enzyme